MIGVILAAGRGTRILPLSNEFPKPILPICNRPLAEYQIEMMKNIGISEVFIVISSKAGAAIKEALGDGSQYGVTLQYVEQQKPLGTAHALSVLEDFINSPLLVFLGDIYLICDDLYLLVEEVMSGKVNATLLSKVEHNPKMLMRNFSIYEDRTGHVFRVIEKPRYPDNQIKGCGVYFFDQHIFDAIRRTPRTAMREEYEITESIQIMINDGLLVSHRSAAKYDLNLTMPYELLTLNLMELKRRGLKKIIGKNARISPGTSIENSIIGEEVTVRCPIKIINSLIFPGVQVTSNNDIKNAIIQRNNIIQCNPQDLK